MPSASSALKSRISAAALRLAGEKGWRSITLEQVAKQAKISLAIVKAHVKSAADIALIIAEEMDREAFASLGKTNGSPRDILFDLLMARFDVMQKHRKAILSMADAASVDRPIACMLARATLEGAYRIAEAAQIKKTPRPVIAAGAAAIYGWAYLAWRNDVSRDLGKTMAALDKALRLSEKLLKLMPQNRAG